MIALIQRVTEASVVVKGCMIANIGIGLLALLGVERDDGHQDAVRIAERLISYRVFSDLEGKMNRSVKDVGGDILLVPQFTLAADTGKGMRPSFHTAAKPADGQRLFDAVAMELMGCGQNVQHGQFGANMQVQLINDGPVTFFLKSHA